MIMLKENQMEVTLRRSQKLRVFKRIHEKFERTYKIFKVEIINLIIKQYYEK